MINFAKRLLILSSVCILLLSGCTKETKRSTVSISIPTGDSTGALFQIGKDISSVLNENLSYMNAETMTSEGGIDNLTQLSSKDNIITYAVTSIAYQSYTGTGNFEGQQNKDLRVIAGLYYNPNQIIVKNDDTINRLEDLVGKSFSPGVLGSTTVTEATTHFQAVDIDMKESINVVNAGFSESILLMQEGELDGTWVMAGIPNEAVETITKNGDGKLIGLSDSTLATLQTQYPWYAKYIIPAGTYDNQDKDIQTSAVKLTIVTSAQLEDDIVYDLTKTLWEHIEELKQKDLALCSVSLEGTITDLADLPIHKGAMKYYKEKGLLK